MTLVKGHVAHKSQSWDSNPDPSLPQPSLGLAVLSRSTGTKARGMENQVQNKNRHQDGHFAPHTSHCTDKTPLHPIPRSSFTAALPERTHHSHFPDEETEAQTDELPVLGYRLKTGLLTQRSCSESTCPTQVTSHKTLSAPSRRTLHSCRHQSHPARNMIWAARSIAQPVSTQPPREQ